MKARPLFETAGLSSGPGDERRLTHLGRRRGNIGAISNNLVLASCLERGRPYGFRISDSSDIAAMKAAVKSLHPDDETPAVLNHRRHDD